MNNKPAHVAFRDTRLESLFKSLGAVNLKIRNYMILSIRQYEKSRKVLPAA